MSTDVKLYFKAAANLCSITYIYIYIHAYCAVNDCVVHVRRPDVPYQSSGVLPPDIFYLPISLQNSEPGTESDC